MDVDIFQAASGGDITSVKSFVATGGDCSTRNGDRETPLHLAVTNGWAEVARILVKDGLADVDARTPSRQWTPLYQACYEGRPDLVKVLVDLRADVTAVQDEGCTPGETFDAGVSPETRRQVRDILQERFKKTGTKHILSHKAAAQGNVDRMQWFIDSGGDINGRDKNNLTMMHLACREGHHNAVNFLLEQGAEVDPKDSKRWTPLYLACTNGVFDMVMLLLSNGAEVNARTHDSRTPLHGACRFHHHDVACVLLEQGAMVDARDGNGDTALHWACERGNYDIVRELINRGADVNTRDKHMYTPLHWACAGPASSPDIARELVARGAELDPRDSESRTPLHLAADMGHEQVVRELLVRGCYTNPQDSGKNTPLHHACAKGREGVVFELLDRGCDLTLMDKDGKVASEVIATAFPPGHVTTEAIKHISGMLRDGPRPPEKAKPMEAEMRCICSLS